jgi:hypothetical protein
MEQIRLPKDFLLCPVTSAPRRKRDAMKDRCRGALIGLAVDDAWEALSNFGGPGAFAQVTGYRSGGPYGLNAGLPRAIRGSSLHTEA